MMKLTEYEKKAQWEVDTWNKNCPEGTEVLLTEDDGTVTETKTRSVAWVVCGSAVVSVEGKRGGYDLERIKQK